MSDINRNFHRFYQDEVSFGEIKKESGDERVC